MANALDVQKEINDKRKEFEEAFKDFHQRVFCSKVLDKNKSPAAKNSEQAKIEAFIKSAVMIENLNQGEGLLALITTAIREMLHLRDRVNDIDYSLCKLLKDLGQTKDGDKEL